MKKMLNVFNRQMFSQKGSLFASAIVLLLLIINISTHSSGSPEVSIASTSPSGESKGSVIAASCGFGDNSGHSIGDTVCGGTCPTGSTPVNGICVQNCTNGAINPSLCNTCPSSQTMVAGRCVITCPSSQIVRNNSCVTCPVGQMPNANQTSCIPTLCQNGATNYPTCTCSSDQVLVNGFCTYCQNGGCTNNKCNNGAVNAPLCNACQNPQFYWNSQTNSCVPNPCGNQMPPANYGQTCGGGVNSCGQNSTAGTIQCNGSCTVTNQNSSCIQTFNVSSTSVYPNGSVDFSWKVLPATDGGSVKCGFYDRSKSNGVGLGVPIPGLQDLDTQADKFRINNIQRNTEFCLVCVYTDKNSNPQTPAALHQWVRVIKVGEN